MENWVIILIIISAIFNLMTLLLYVIKVAVFKYYGNKYIPIVGAFIVSLGFALFANFYTAAGPSTLHPMVNVSSSIFDALKMMAVAFDRGPINAYFATGNPYLVTFGVGYIATSVFALIWISFAAIVLFYKGIKAVTITGFRKINKNKDAYYIFSDPKVTVAARLGESLKKDGHAVTMVLTRGSQKTQDGTEYRSMLISKGFDVKVENYTKGLGAILLGRHFNKRFRLLLTKKFFYRVYKNHKIYVLGLFSNDEDSLNTANTFKQAIESNIWFKKVKKKFDFFKLKDKLDAINPNDKEDLSRLKESDLKNIRRFLRGKGPSSLEELRNNFAKYFNLIEEKSSSYRITEYHISALKSFKIYLTYHGADIDLTNHYSESTLQMINTLSEYDMISSEFMLDNQIDKFIDIEKLLAEKDSSDNKSMHVTFFGLGKVNRPILKKMTYAYQLWKDNKDKVTYHVVDQNSENAVNYFKSEYTEENSNPLLYRIYPEENGNDIRSFYKINEYVNRIYKEENRFNIDGFEIFVISVVNTTTDIEIALSLRKALFKNCDNIDKLRRTVIFVRISTPQVADNFIQGNAPFAIKQSQFNKYNLLDDDDKNKESRTLVPIVVFGENALMSNYLANNYKQIEKISLRAIQSYHGCELEEATIRSLIMDKKEAISNSETIYCLRTKLKLLHCELNEDFKIEFKDDSAKYLPLLTNKTGFEECDFYKNPDERIKAVVHLEHNRWTAVAAVVDHYGKWDVESFKKKIAPYTDKEGEQKVKWETKDENKAKHVCMLTCEDLKKLEEDIPEDKKIINRFEDNGYSIDLLKNKLHKLVYSNDLDAMSKVFSALNENK